MNYPIFISYSRKDLSKAKRIKSEIESKTGALCWMDMDGIETGEQFEDVIISAIDNCKIVIFILSENSMQSKWVKDEVRYAYKTLKKVVPLKIDDSELTGWFLFKFSGHDVITYKSSEQKGKMLNDIKEWTGNLPPINIEPESPGHGKTKQVTNTPPKPKTPYFSSCLNPSIAILVIIFAIIALFMLSFMTPAFAKGLIFNTPKLFYKDLLLLIDLGAIIGCTLLLKKKNFLKWSFLVLDAIAIFLLFYICHNVYNYAINKQITYTSESYRLLYALGYELRNGIGGGLKYFLPLFILHNACVLGIMYSRVIWYKLPYSIRRFTKRQIK